MKKLSPKRKNLGPHIFCSYISLVPEVGLEPTRDQVAHDFESCVSTSSTTLANVLYLPIAQTPGTYSILR